MNALDRTLAQINREFGRAALIRHFKDEIRWVLREPDHPSIAVRYGTRSILLRGLPLDAACTLVALHYREEIKAQTVAATLGRDTGLSTRVLRELRLILRWMRLKRMHGSFPIIAAEMQRRAA